MAIPLLGEIERLITEHGSATILKERIAFASDQYVALERKLSESEIKLSEANTKIKQLEIENQSLKLDIDKQNTVINNLNLENENLQNNFFHDKPLEEIEIKILKKIFESPQTEKSLSEYTKLSYEHVSYYLEKLIAKNIIRKARLGTGTTIYSIEQSGREYLIQNFLI